MFRVLLLIHTNTLKTKREKSSFTTFLYIKCICVEDTCSVCVLDLKFIFLPFVGVELLFFENVSPNTTQHKPFFSLAVRLVYQAIFVRSRRVSRRSLCNFFDQDFFLKKLYWNMNNKTEILTQ